MKIHEAPQGTDAWRAQRVGIPTASQFHRILTPGGKLSEQRKAYMGQLLAERFYQQPDADLDPDDSVRSAGDDSGYMGRGTALEPKAIKWYSFKQDVDVKPCGLVTDDAGRYGASPDGLVNDDGCVEIKCPALARVLTYWLKGQPKDHAIQRQGQLWVLGRSWSDLGVYHSIEEIRTIRRDERNEALISSLSDAVLTFCGELEEAWGRLAEAKADYDARRRQQSEDDVPAGIS